MSIGEVSINIENTDLGIVEDLGLLCPIQIQPKKRKIREGKTKHGEIHTKLYKVWGSMRHRCNSPTNKRASSYFDKGITVCSDWDDFIVFREWAYSNGYAEGLSIDRIDNNLGYCPSNCRWTTMYIQSANTKVLRSTNKSGYRGVHYCTRVKKYKASIRVEGIRVNLGCHIDVIDAAKAYQSYIIVHNLEHSYIPVLTEDEIKGILSTMEEPNEL